MSDVTRLTPPISLATDAPVLVLVTWPDDRDPQPFLRALVEERLVACGNALPSMRSIYRWQDAVHDDAERQLVLKTSAGRLDALQARVAELHPYDVPEFLAIPVHAAASAYLGWLRQAVAPPNPDADPGPAASDDLTGA